MEKNNNIDLGLGFILEIIETVPDENGCNLEGFIYFLGTILKEIPPQRKYKNRKALIRHFENIIIPGYIASNRASVYNISNFEKQWSIDKFVSHTLLTNKFKYGQTVDVVVLLENEGYFVPKMNGETIFTDDMTCAIAVIRKISLALLKALDNLNFKPDRNNGNLKGHEFKESYGNTRNIIYTRYPWTANYKMIKTVMSFISISARNFFAGSDLDDFEKMFPEAYMLSMELAERLQDVHIGTSQVVLDTGFKKTQLQILSLLNKDESIMYEKFKELRPKIYDDMLNAA